MVPTNNKEKDKKAKELEKLIKEQKADTTKYITPYIIPIGHILNPIDGLRGGPDLVTQFKRDVTGLGFGDTNLPLKFAEGTPQGDCQQANTPERSSRGTESRQEWQPPISGPPDYVISIQIPGWKYNPELRCIRRVFKETNQGLELDVEESLSWLCPHLSDRKLERKLLQEEGSYNNINNQKVMQEMYERVSAKRPMLDNNPFYTVMGSKEKQAAEKKQAQSAAQETDSGQK